MLRLLFDDRVLRTRVPCRYQPQSLGEQKAHLRSPSHLTRRRPYPSDLLLPWYLLRPLLLPLLPLRKHCLLRVLCVSEPLALGF